jgi:hypothetical protein
MLGTDQGRDEIHEQRRTDQRTQAVHDAHRPRSRDAHPATNPKVKSNSTAMTAMKSKSIESP